MNKITDFYNSSVFFFNRHLMPKMSPEEKKITLIVVAILGCIALLYTARLCYRYAFKGNVTPVETKSNSPLPVSKLADDEIIPEIDLEANHMEVNKNKKAPAKKKSNPALSVVPKSVVPTPPGGFPPPPPPPPGGMPPRPGTFTPKKGGPVETPAQRHLRLENAKIKRNQLQRLSFTDFYQEGSTLKQKRLDELQQQIIIYTDVVQQLSADTALNPKLQEKIKSYQEKIDASMKEIQAAKTVEMKLKIDEFKTALNKFTTEEIQLILGCYYSTKDPVDEKNSIVKFYQKFPAGEMKDTCAKNQAIFKTLFDNCSSQYLMHMNTLIILRAEGKGQNPVYAPTEYDPKKSAKKPSIAAAPPIGNLMDELRKKQENWKKPGGDISIVKTGNNTEDSELAKQLKKIAGSATTTPPKGASEAAASPIGKPLKPVKKLTEEKEKALRTGYILEKLQLIANNLTKSGFDYTISNLNEEKENYELILALSEDEGDIAKAKKQLAEIEDQIEEINIKKELALAYLKQNYAATSDLDGAFNDPFMTYVNYKLEAEKYAEQKINEIKNR